MKKNIFLSLFFACIPGFGQMYYGYMKRGFSLTSWFIAIPLFSHFIDSVLLPSSYFDGMFLSLFMISVWAYSFFDTFNIRNMSPEQRANFHDEYLPNSNWLNKEFADKKHKLKINNSRFIGWALIVIGGLILYNNLSRFIADTFSRIFNIDYSIISNIFSKFITLFIGAAVIFIGIKMLHFGKKSPNKTPESTTNATDSDFDFTSPFSVNSETITSDDEKSPFTSIPQIPETIDDKDIIINDNSNENNSENPQI